MPIELKHLPNLEARSCKSCEQRLTLTIQESHFQLCQLQYWSYTITGPSFPKSSERMSIICFPKSVIWSSQASPVLLNLQPTCQHLPFSILESPQESLIPKLLLAFLLVLDTSKSPLLFLPSYCYSLPICCGRL